MTFPILNLPQGRLAALLTIPAISTLAACGGNSPGPGDLVGLDDDEGLCSIPREQILSGQRKDGIPALTNPEMAFAGQPGTEYLREDDRVIGLIFEGEAIAVPLNIMWWHEVVKRGVCSNASLGSLHSTASHTDRRLGQSVCKRLRRDLPLMG